MTFEGAFSNEIFHLARGVGREKLTREKFEKAHVLSKP